MKYESDYFDVTVAVFAIALSNMALWGFCAIARSFLLG